MDHPTCHCEKRNDEAISIQCGTCARCPCGTGLRPRVTSADRCTPRNDDGIEPRVTVAI